MAEKLRAELEILTAKAEKDLKRFDRSLAGVERRITSMGGKGGKSLKPLGEGLSAATVNANEFEKSMAAANARVIAFGASAGLILQVQRALKETVRATIEVEKSLTDINVVLNNNTKFTNKYQSNQILKINIAHNEGNYFTDKKHREELQKENLIAFKYCDESGNISQNSNPNGALDNIAGIFNLKKNILGMMPHPERMVDKFISNDDGVNLFSSLIN